jgi:hypothetical protein
MANDSRCSRQAVLLYATHDALRFPGYETRSSPYRMNHPLVPIQAKLSLRLNIFGNRLSKHLPAIPYGTFIVELFTPRDLPWSPKQSRSGMACYQTHGSRRRPYVERPIAGSEPRVWIWLQTNCSHTILNTDGLQQNSIASISVSPRIGARKEQNIHRIES